MVQLRSDPSNFVLLLFFGPAVDAFRFHPQSLLTHVSRSTKNTLNRLGVFTVSSFHAYICARSPSLLNNLLAGRGATRRRTVAPILSRSNSISSRKSQSISSQQTSGSAANENDKLFRVNLPDGQVRVLAGKRNEWNEGGNAPDGLQPRHRLMMLMITDGHCDAQGEHDGGGVSGQRLRQKRIESGRAFRARQEASRHGQLESFRPASHRPD